MGYRYDEKLGYWIAFYSKRHPVTKESVSFRRTKLKTKAEAIKAERALIQRVLDKCKEATVPRWRECVKSYLEDCANRDLTAKTIINCETTLQKHTFPDWEKKFVNIITTEEIRNLIRVKCEDKSVYTKKALLKFIRLVFDHALQNGSIVRNPTPKMAFRIGDKIKKVLTKQQVRHLLTQAKIQDWPWYPHYAMAIYTGMRNGELYALQWDKVDLDNNLIVVDSSWNNKDGFKSTKSGNDRIVEIAPTLKPVLQELRLSSGGSEFVLPRVKGWSKGEQARELRKFLIGIGLPPVRFHDLRATWCTIMLSHGIEPIKVMTMGGWCDMKTMMIYIRKSGVSIKGITHVLDLHDPSLSSNNVVHLK